MVTTALIALLSLAIGSLPKLSSYYLRQGGNFFAGLCLFVCVSVCTRYLKKLRTDLSEILKVSRAWHKLQVIQFWA